MVKLKRIYEVPEESDGFRILIDRLWPRGISKDEAKIDQWLRDIAPSNELRKWFGHDPEKWPEFQIRYAQELQAQEKAVLVLKDIIQKEKTVTLLYSASDEKHNNAVSLVKLLKL